MSASSDFDGPLMHATLLLADAAQVADGRLFILGGGLAEIGPGPQPMAIALLLEVPWDQAERQHDWKFELLDEDGGPVFFDDQPILVGGQFETQRPEGWPPGSPLSVPLAINFTALPIEPGKGYQWRLSIDDTGEPHWRLSFRVRPNQP